MKNKKSFNNQISFFICFLFIISFIGIVDGHQNLSFHKYGYPEFTIGNTPLIYSYSTSYSLDNTKYERPYYSSSDKNLFLAYSITGKKYLGRQVRVGDTCVPLQFAEIQVNAPYSICMSTEMRAPNGTTIIPEVMVLYSTTIPEIDEYVNNPSFEGEIAVHYNVTNPKISEVSPIILNLGNIPIRVNDEKIEDILNKPIFNDTILVFGSNTSLIFNKGDSTKAGISTISGSVNYTEPKKLLSVSRTNPDFSYIFYRDNDDYYVKIQRMTHIQEGTLALTFRLIQIDYSINIEDPTVDNTYNFLDNAPKRLSFKPNLQINISNNEIHQLNVTFLKNGSTEKKSIPLDQNGTYYFNDLMEAYGEPWLFPFDSYTSRIVVSPPLLISNHRDILTPENSGFNADIEIDYKNIFFNFSRPVESKIGFLASVILVIIGIIYLRLKPESDNILKVISIIAVIVSIFTFLNSNGLNHIFSIGSLVLVTSIVLTIIIFKKSMVPSEIQQETNVKNKKEIKKKRKGVKKR